MIEITNILDVEKYLNGIDGVVFDLDDTLYPEKEYVWSGYHAVAAQFPQVECMTKKLWTVFEKGRKAIDEVLETESMLNQKDEALRVYRFHKPDIHLYEGVFEMLQRIKVSGKKIGIITDGRPEGQWAKIKALGIKEQIDEIIITDELGGIEYRKPNKIAFEIMQKRFCIPFVKMCYVGDNIKKDFIAPELLGIMSIYYQNEDGLYSNRITR